MANQNVCLCGDFNVVRYIEERRSVGSVFSQVGSANLNHFTEGVFLDDLPLQGRTYTWFREDGKSMSLIDQFLLSESWCLTWPNSFQLALSCCLSDHCPLELSIDEDNWGPRSLCMLKCWESFLGYNTFVRDRWSLFQLEGWGVYVLKEKFKLIKLALKEWHPRHSQNLPVRILSLKDKIAALDLKGELEVLLDGEVEELLGFLEELFSSSQINSSICWQ